MFIPFFSLLTFFTDAVFQKRFIKNENLPICSNCVYFDCEKSKSEFDTRNAKAKYSITEIRMLCKIC